MKGDIVKTSPSLAKVSATDRARRVTELFFTRGSKRTREAYRDSLGVFANWLSLTKRVSFGGSTYNRIGPSASYFMQLSGIEAHETAIAYVSWMQGVELNGHAGRYKPYSPSSINLHLSALKSLTKLGNQLGACNYVLTLKGVKPGLVRDVRGPTVETVKLLLDAAVKAGPEEEALMRLLFERGLRSVEVRELQWQHVREASKPPVVMVRGKGQTGVKPLTLNESTAAALKRWRGSRFGNFGGNFVFPGRSPLQQLSKQGLWRRVKAIGASIDVKLWPHALRHSSLTALLDATNGDMRSVMKFSRHANVQTLLRYDDERRDVGGKLAEQLGEMVK